MAKKILVLGLSLFLITSLNVFGAKKPKTNKKMLQRIEVMDTICYTKEPIITDYPYFRLLSPEPKVTFPFSDDTVGYTYYDYQFNATQHRQIARDSAGTLHFTWMNLVGPSIYNDRYFDYNARYAGGAWLISGGMHVTTADTRAGYGGVDILPDNREVLGYHCSEPTSHYTFWGATISIEDSLPGAGQFNQFDIPDSGTGRSDKGFWPAVACSKLTNGDTSYIHITHEMGSTSCSLDKPLGYVRCFEKPGTRDTLVCESPGWESPLLIPKDTKLVPNKVPYRYAIARLGCGVIATSPVSQKVCITWLQNYASSSTQNEVYYMESTNNGDNWIDMGYMTPIKITNYEGTGIRAYGDLAAVYDYNDELHIIWTTFPATNSNDVSLWHWSSATGIRKVSSALAPYTVDPGAWNLLIAKFTLGVGSDPSDSAYNYLYVNYTKFKEGDISAGGFANGDICVKASSNGGLTWGPEINLTNTNSDGCLPGNCESEHWSSMAEKVDSFLYIQYIYDLDAGGVPQEEGTYTLNPVRYLKYPRFLVQPIPVLSFSPTQMVSPIRWATNGGITSDSLIVNNENGTAALYVKLSGPSWLNISPANFYIAEGAPDQTVNLTFNGAGHTDTLLIDSLLIATNSSLLRGAESYIDTDWVKIHFVVADTFYHVEYDTVNTGTGGIIATVSNVGNLGNGEDNCGICYKGNDYLSEFTPVILVDIPGYGWSASTWMDDSHDFLPESHPKVTEYPSLHATVVSQAFAPVNPRLAPPYHWYWSWWTVADQSIFFWKPSDPHISSTEYEKVILKYTKLIQNPPPSWWCYITEEPPTLPSTYLGFAADWDVPDFYYYRNIGGYDDTLNLIWLTSSDLSSLNGGFLFLYVIKDGDTTFSPVGAHVLANSTQLYLQNLYDDDSLYKYMSTPGWSIESDSAQDMNILVSAAYLDAPAPTTEVSMKYALMVTDQGYEDLIELADGLKGARCADANEDGNVSVSDVITIVNYLFKGGPEPWLYYCDINGDCGVSVSDIVYLINYLFKGGSSPKCNCADCTP